MEKFWKWMKEKGYFIEQEKDWFYDFLIDDYSIKGEFPNIESIPKQMLIGYMIEYLMTITTYNNFSNIMPFVYNNINSVYNNLERIIIQESN